MSGTQADISITAGSKGAEDGWVKLTAKVLNREEASKVFTKTALKNIQSPASSDPVLIGHIDAYFIVSSHVFLNGLPAETINGFVNFSLMATWTPVLPGVFCTPGSTTFRKT